MVEYKESLLTKILKFFGIIKEVEISKKEMCEAAKDSCNRHCEFCAWKDDD